MPTYTDAYKDPGVMPADPGPAPLFGSANWPKWMVLTERREAWHRATLRHMLAKSIDALYAQIEAAGSQRIADPAVAALLQPLLASVCTLASVQLVSMKDAEPPLHDEAYWTRLNSTAPVKKPE